MTPKGRAVLLRFAKVAGFSLFGYALASVGALVTWVLTSAQVDQTVVITAAAVIGGAAASIQKAVNWQSVGIDPPPSTIEIPQQQQQQQETQTQ